MNNTTFGVFFGPAWRLMILTGFIAGGISLSYCYAKQ
jgi:hypothetical protein